jgi:membrane protease YdiL (CAAX protease family)
LAGRSLLRSSSGDLRPGWKILVFLLLTAAIVMAALLLQKLFGGGGGLLSLALVIASVLLSSLVMTRVFHRKPLGAIGLRFHQGAIRETAQGLVQGFVMMGTIFTVQVLAGWGNAEWAPASAATVAGVLGYGALQFLLAGFFEELVFRGYLYQVLMQGITVIPATLLLAVGFALAHGGNPNVTVFAFVNIGLASVWLSLAYLRTRSLWLPTALHFSWNFSQTTIFGFPTSGIRPAGNSLTIMDQSGPDWLTGGTFGPEGGALASLVLVAASWWLFTARSVYAEPDLVTLETRP